MFVLMKKTSLAISTVLLAGLLLLSVEMLSGTPLGIPFSKTAYPAATAYPATSSPLLRSPLRLLFPFEAFTRHEVCRRPLYLYSARFNAPQLSDFHYNGLFFGTRPATPGYIRLDEKLTFRKGNSFLLVPQSLTLPVNPGLQPLPRPSMNIPLPD
jgi:hypothetical protein